MGTVIIGPPEAESLTAGPPEVAVEQQEPPATEYTWFDRSIFGVVRDLWLTVTGDLSGEVDPNSGLTAGTAYQKEQEKKADVYAGDPDTGITGVVKNLEIVKNVGATFGILKWAVIGSLVAFVFAVGLATFKKVA